MKEQWQPPPDLDLGNGYLLDQGSGEVRNGHGVEATLTPLQTGVMHVLFEYQGRVVPPDVLIQQAYGLNLDRAYYVHDGERAMVYKTVRRLEKKLEPTGVKVETLRGRGVRLAKP
jgi:DNA-binding response OmpR family regulator